MTKCFNLKFLILSHERRVISGVHHPLRRHCILNQNRSRTGPCVDLIRPLTHPKCTVSMMFRESNWVLCVKLVIAYKCNIHFQLYKTVKSNSKETRDAPRKISITLEIMRFIVKRIPENGFTLRL